MATDRKFYRTEITFIVLSEEPIHPAMDMEGIVAECESGGYVADYNITVPDKRETLTGKQMAEALYKAGSDPSFFRLDDDGNDDGNDNEEDN
jgi:hypothetical protein